MKYKIESFTFSITLLFVVRELLGGQANELKTWMIQFYISSYLTESRFESPISISKLNNYSDFGRKSENYFNVKIFSDSRPKSAQKLILKVFSDFHTQIICRLSEFFKNKIWRHTWLGVGLASVNFCWDRWKSLGKWIHRSVGSVSTNYTFLNEGYSVRLSLF